jgi:hypothetical protein
VVRMRQEVLLNTEEGRVRTRRSGAGMIAVLPLGRVGEGQRKDSWDEARGTRYEAPPPYMPRVPEPVRSC